MVNQHSCNRYFLNNNVTSKFLVKVYFNKIRFNHKWPIDSFHVHVMADLKVKVFRAKLYRAKSHAFNMINSSLNKQYNRLYDYVAELKKSNPG